MTTPSLFLEITISTVLLYIPVFSTVYKAYYVKLITSFATNWCQTSLLHPMLTKRFVIIYFYCVYPPAFLHLTTLSSYAFWCLMLASSSETCSTIWVYMCGYLHSLILQSTCFLVINKILSYIKSS
jgi:hypothetical protein